MIDIRTSSEKRRGWWIEERSTIPCAVAKDGLIVAFRREDAEAIMDKYYPYVGQGFGKYWYFNKSRDREIAEVDAEDRIIANPRILWDHFLKNEENERQC